MGYLLTKSTGSPCRVLSPRFFTSVDMHIMHTFGLDSRKGLNGKHIYVNLEKSRPMTCFLKSVKRLKKLKVVGYHE